MRGIYRAGRRFPKFRGGFYFGGGNAQLDFRDMKLDWA
jgi:hypothetical protein